uniref:macrophage mannose receptor 1-like n=1 Tax=Scatophagus argus TaxID=75038 RepID=UPI001ED853D7|nr:macrophage mannose receptor 1-like [Scatophagus argus]
MPWSLFLFILLGQCSFLTCQLYEYQFIAHKKIWKDAQTYCRENHTDLATVFDMKDVKRLQDEGKGKGKGKEAWIGLFSQTSPNEWKWSLPGVEFNETEWDSTEPNDKIKPENCVRMIAHKWQDIPCCFEHKFICYNETNTTHKFHLIEQEKKWREAQCYCRKYHTDLVSGIKQLNDRELTSNNNLSNKSDKWIIGLFRDTWTWSDGSSFSFRHWSQSFSDSQTNDKQCALIMLVDKGRWKSESCDSTKSFFCYDDKTILIKEEKTWDEALDYCREHHNDLVSITNLGEQRWVQQKAKNATTTHVWLGLRYTCTLEFWFWMSDKAVNYENWASGGKQDGCDMSGAMETGGEHKWVKLPDAEKFNFICSK